MDEKKSLIGKLVSVLNLRKDDLSDSYSKIVERVIVNYDIGNFKKIIKIFKDDENLVIRFKTNKGEYVFKEYYRELTPIEKTKENLFLLKKFIINNPDIPIPLCLTKDGFPYYEENKRFFTLDYYIRGNHLYDDYSLERVINAAKILADLHKRTRVNLNENEIIEKVNSMKIISRLFESSNACKCAQGFVGFFKEKVDKTEFDTFLIEKLFPLIEVEYRKLIISLDKIDLKSHKSYLVGDINPGNIIFNKAEIVALIDYETINFDFAGYEKVKAMTHFIRFKKGKGFDLEHAREFVKAYNQVFGELDISGIEAVTIMRHCIIELLALIISGRIKYGGSLEPIELYYNKLKWLSDNENKIKNLFD
ncbi:MAG: hypothetical protein PF569_10050 [Candidatus Woesearchaeota archaeon]|jgi:Ser/Thr protein kinase RdoA (MazF antagonist)|nr:hypothetical protein [Candidatus Woesearchaeota archaeon]